MNCLFIIIIYIFYILKYKYRSHILQMLETITNNSVILYGEGNFYSDVTLKAYQESRDNKIILPASDDERSSLLGDPHFGVIKKIVIIHDNKNVTVYSHKDPVVLNFLKYIPFDNHHELNKIHAELNIEGGSFVNEYPEQLMSVQYIPPTAKILELGGNIGRNALVISRLLNNQKNLVVLECDTTIVPMLERNKMLNNSEFIIEPKALSKSPLYMVPGSWQTKNEPITDGIELETITFDSLCAKHDIIFDTIVADCEGALYQILKDDPLILDKISLLIVENDYLLIDEKSFVDNLLILHNFTRIYFQPGGLMRHPCKDEFYEVWKKLPNIP